MPDVTPPAQRPIGHPEGSEQVATFRTELVEAAARREAVTEALASVRAEDLEPSPERLETLEAIAAGRMSTAQARERTLARYRR